MISALHIALYYSTLLSNYCCLLFDKFKGFAAKSLSIYYYGKFAQLLA